MACCYSNDLAIANGINYCCTMCVVLFAYNRDLDIYNVGAAHLKKQAGCTPVERASFDSWLIPPSTTTNTTDTAADTTAAAAAGGGGSSSSTATAAAAVKGGNSSSGKDNGSGDYSGSKGCVKDAFRHFYPTARGCYTYWSARANGVSYCAYIYTSTHDVTYTHDVLE
jgi:exonuclease III